MSESYDAVNASTGKSTRLGSGPHTFLGKCNSGTITVEAVIDFSNTIEIINLTAGEVAKKLDLPQVLINVTVTGDAVALLTANHGS